jgi:GNAT superfamily N-acetyltransferase
MSLTVRPLTAETFEDFADVVNPNRRDTHCWCMSFRLSAAEMRELADTREGAMRAVAGGDPSPGLVGYDADGRPVAWCSISPRTAIPRLEASAKMPRIDDVDVWSIICLVVRGGCRRAGTTTELLEAAVAYAAEHGAPAVEAYPVDNRAADGTPERIDTTMAYCGTWSMFDRAGFTQVGTTEAQGSKRPRIVMRRTCS